MSTVLQQGLGPSPMDKERMYCIDNPATKIHEQAVGLCETSEFGETIRFALPNILNLAYDELSAAVLKKEVSNGALLLDIRGLIPLKKRLSVLESPDFDFASGHREALVIELGPTAGQLAVAEETIQGTYVDVGSDLSDVWLEGVHAINQAAAERGIASSDIFINPGEGTRLNQLLARIACREVGLYLYENNVPALYNSFDRRTGQIILGAEPVHVARNQHINANVSAPLRAIANLVNLANFAAHMLDEQLPYNKSTIYFLLKNGRSRYAHSSIETLINQ